MKYWLIAHAMAVLPATAAAQENLLENISEPTVTVSGREILPAGTFKWTLDNGPAGPLTIRVNLKTQMLYVSRAGIPIGASSISSGKVGHETPTGTFPILQKNKDHKSNIYNNAPMPFMQRLTWDGIALHAGKLPGRPASHGCIRLPKAFVETLFLITRLGDQVEVVNEGPTLDIEIAYAG